MHRYLITANKGKPAEASNTIPEKILIKFFEKSGISKNEFAKRAGFNRRSILEWINKEKSISEESYYKIKVRQF